MSSLILLPGTMVRSSSSSCVGNKPDDDDIYIMVKCMSVCDVFAYFIFSHFWALLGLEIREKVSRNRRNDKKCLEMGET